MRVANEQLAITTPTMGRQVVKKSGVLLLEGWDISSAIAFDSLRRRHYIDLDTMDLK